jgi:quinol-cytochrome oxidoreductase complex cytochrome b subunit
MSVPEDSDHAGVRQNWVDWLERRINLTQFFSLITHFGLVYTPIDAARPIREVLRDVSRQKVPTYARWPRVLGVLAAILFTVEVVTGLLLAFYYRPTPQEAYISTRTIVRDLPFGWFVHQIHAWGAWSLIAVVLVRVARLLWDGLFRAPRELLWLSGVALGVLVLNADFTGRLLAWDTHSYWTLVRGLEVVQSIPIVGAITSFILGGTVVNTDMLIRFYILHIVILPMAYVAFLYVTFGTQRRVGLGQPESGVAGSTTTLRHHLYSVLILTVLAFGIMVTLSVLTPFPFRAQADPYSTPVGLGPPWYLLAPYALTEGTSIPSWIGGLLTLFVGAGILLLPFWWRGEATEASVRRVRIGGIALLVVWIALSVMGWWIDRVRS